MSSKSNVLCCICSDPADLNSENEDLPQQLILFWELIGIDEKPRNHKVCKSCAAELEELTATNEAWAQLKHNLMKSQEKLASVVAVGLKKRRKDNIPLLTVHEKLESATAPSDKNSKQKS